uniref:Pepsin-I3 domain-containing protein n=1 Tax=Anisakis simplex TaxID=6269 RepID=A0A0M3J7C6_ANISI
LYSGGINMGQLNETDQEEMKKYLEELDKFEDAQRSLFVEDYHFGDEPNQEHVPPKHLRPSFCNITHVYIDGCEVVQGKVYIEQLFVRDLTSEELEAMEVFMRQAKAYYMYRKRLYSEKDRFEGDDGESSESISKVPRPKNPKVCFNL